MTAKVFFLADILNPFKQPSILEPDVQAYLKMMFSGPGDGETDIEWQETGAAYYGHLEAVEQLTSEDREAYLSALTNDIAAWRIIVGDGHMFDVVEEHLKKIKS